MGLDCGVDSPGSDIRFHCMGVLRGPGRDGRGVVRVVDKLDEDLFPAWSPPNSPSAAGIWARKTRFLYFLDICFFLNSPSCTRGRVERVRESCVTHLHIFSCDIYR